MFPHIKEYINIRYDRLRNISQLNSFKSIKINIGHGRVVESLHEARDRLGNCRLEVFDELVGVLVEELVNSFGQAVSLSSEQVVHLDVETAQLDCDVWISIDDQPDFTSATFQGILSSSFCTCHFEPSVEPHPQWLCS